MKKEDLFIPVLLGTGRKDRQSEHVAKYILEKVKKYGYKTQLIDVRFLSTTATIPSWVKSSKTKSWSKTMLQADGLIVVSPEYSHGYPGELKIFMDGIFKEYERKPVAICGVSSGGFGGARVIEALRLYFSELRLIAIRQALYFANVETLFTKSGNIKDKSFDKKIQSLLDDFNFYAMALKKAREEIK